MNDDDRNICGAKTRAGSPCAKSPVPGRERCHLHGGNQKRGVEHHLTRHGRYSKHLPTRMIADYEAALSDPNLLSTREDIAALSARQTDLARRVDSGEAGVIWRGMRKSMADFRRAQRNSDTDKMADALADLDGWIGAGNSDYYAWEEYMGVTERLRKLRETERKLLEAHNATINADQAMTLVGALIHSVREHVADPDARLAISRDIERAMGRQRVQA